MSCPLYFWFRVNKLWCGDIFTALFENDVLSASEKADIGEIDPFQEDFSAFVFKIQANMNKAHRDRIAFMRICSGKFEAGMEVTHVQGGNKRSSFPSHSR